MYAILKDAGKTPSDSERLKSSTKNGASRSIYSFSRLHGHMSSCVCDVASWMQSNRLQLSTSMSEVLWCSSVRRQHLIPDTPLIGGVHAVLAARSVRNLGIYISIPTSPCGSTSPRLHRAVSVLCVRSAVFVGQSANMFFCLLSSP